MGDSPKKADVEVVPVRPVPVNSHAVHLAGAEWLKLFGAFIVHTTALLGFLWVASLQLEHRVTKVETHSEQLVKVLEELKLEIRELRRMNRAGPGS